MSSFLILSLYTLLLVLQDFTEGNTLITDCYALGSKKIIEKISFFSDI